MRKVLFFSRIKEMHPGAGKHVPALMSHPLESGAFPVCSQPAVLYPGSDRSSDQPPAPPITAGMLTPRTPQVTTKPMGQDERFLEGRKNPGRSVPNFVGLFFIVLKAKSVQMYQVGFLPKELFWSRFKRRLKNKWV